MAWLTFLGLAVSKSRSVSFSAREWLALTAAIGISVWCMAKPLGGPKYDLREPTHLLGAFVSRTSWGLVLFGAILTIGGAAGSMAAIYDVSTGRASVGEVFKASRSSSRAGSPKGSPPPMTPSSKRHTPTHCSCY